MNPHSPYAVLANIAKGSQITRVHTQWKKGTSTTNVVTYGIRDKKTVMHIAREGRTTQFFQIFELPEYSLKNAILQAQKMLDEL